MKRKILQSVVAVYTASAVLMIPYYNWEYARANGFSSWLAWGDWISTAKGFAWPYFVIRGLQNGKSDVQTRDPGPPLNAAELEVYSRFLSKMDKGEISQQDLHEIRETMRGYVLRTGRKLTQKEFEGIVAQTKLVTLYLYEHSQSTLFSWDQHKLVTTDKFDRLYEMMKASGTRKEVQLKLDKEILRVAAANEKQFADESGQQYEFDRSTILHAIKQNETADQNMNKFLEVSKEFVE